MKVLVIGSQQIHSHCYGHDFLLHGLYAILGHANVFPWPEGETQHVGPRGTCSICLSGYDSNSQHPRKGHTLSDAIAQADCAIVTAQPGDNTLRPPASHLAGAVKYNGAGQALNLQRLQDDENRLREFREQWNADKPIAIVDQSDAVPGSENCMSPQQLREYYQHVIGDRLNIAAFFRREVPLRHYAHIPCPLSYPATRVPRGPTLKMGKVFYWAAAHGNDPHSPGIPRRLIVESLTEHVPAAQRNVRLLDGNQRNSPHQYHRQMLNSLVAVSWNGGLSFDCNRFWESFAYGCALVAERPRIEMPYPFEDHVHCRFVDYPEDVGPVVAELLANDRETRAMALRGHQHFLRYHTSEKRAEYVLDGLLAACPTLPWRV